MMKCEYCGERKVSAVIFDDEFKYICEDCLQSLRETFGEINLEYEYLLNPKLTLDWMKRKANSQIKYLRKKLELLKRCEKGESG